MRKNDIEMSDIIYLISSSFCYDKIILHDAGPNYAESMGLHYDTVSNIELYKNRYIIIDNRLLKEDCDMIYEF